MSEYQYYEWQALDRPLTPQEQAEVGALSSHIDVTATQAVVTYSWGGDFRHDPLQVLARYFDAFIYLSSWGSRQLAFRFPRDLLPCHQIEPYLWEEYVQLKTFGDALILDISPLDEDGERWGGWVEDEDWLSILSRLRNDLLAGDYRFLYLAWLLAADLDWAHEEALEPPVPSGLQELSPALVSFMEFFELDEYLVQAAAEANPPLGQSPAVPAEEAIARLSPEERNDFLIRLALGEPHLTVKFNRRLQELMGTAAPESSGPRRTWGELQARAEQLRQEAEQQAREEAEAKRLQELQALAAREDTIWQEVMALIEAKTSASYDAALDRLFQLQALADHQGRTAEFQARIAELRERYPTRYGLRRRLDRLQRP